MKVEFNEGIIVILLLVNASLIQMNAVKAVDYDAITTIYASPSSIEATELGEIFTVHINVSEVVDLYAWQAGVTFNGAVLNCTGVYEGEFLKRSNASTIFLEHYLDVNNSEGVIYYRGSCLLGAIPGVDGSGQLFTVTFEAIGTGVSDFHLTDIILLNSALEDIRFEVTETFVVPFRGVSYTVEIVNNLTGTLSPPDPPSSGSFHYSFRRQDREIRFKTLSPYRCYYKLFIPKDLVWCDSISDWEVTVDGAATSPVASENGEYTLLQLDCSGGDHAVEIVGANVVGNPSDFNGDGIVDFADIDLIILSYGTGEAAADWTRIYDINGDGVVDLMDIFKVILHFGEN